MKKPLLHVTLYLVGLFGAAQLIHAFGSGFGSYEPGGFYTPDGTKVPIAEIANFLTGGGYLGGDQDVHPRGRLTPGLRVKQGYDRPRWDYFDAQGCILIEHNSVGFRDEEFPLQKPAGEFRVLALGDSFTYGSGVQAQDAWPQVLERDLSHGGRKVQVINCGFAAGSYAPAGYDTWMASDGLLLQPDLVVVGFCLNDATTNRPPTRRSLSRPRFAACRVASRRRAPHRLRRRSRRREARGDDHLPRLQRPGRHARASARCTCPRGRNLVAFYRERQSR